MVYVLVEHAGGSLDAVTGELITAARPLGAVTAVVVGTPGTANQLAEQLRTLGADTIVAAEADHVAQRLIIPATDALSILAAANPAPILIAHGPSGNEIAGRLAARLASGVLCDVVAINPDLTATQSIFGDTITIGAAVGGASPIFTLRPGAVDAEPQAAPGTLVEQPLPEATTKDVTVTGFTPAVKGDRPELTQAKVVVAGGRGVGDEGFATYVEPLADALGGAVGATRDAVDAGAYDGAAQIGQTGVTVSPDLYIGLGISGAIQHKSGMQTSGTIVAINNDEDAHLFEIADFGIVGDVEKVVPEVIELIKARRG
ncbi:electron transfer flavoprotein subunit alpha/FixB family protein [Corynebacterium aquilae]|uniref:Electron transfer flavoprotein subunit alpha n=1 Tax=Corynebacterium aquilae DSM 44791 TaxID=1431546 RepID=A0A1L7CFH4_9CORY|nr:electron transfer flavoprotein subunit alpha/FixB family protein [Corynebacterium aquilae]APT84578.1 electron transfer flavoprotein subunit alpha [Corynebacterium aquilae DSM 44791]